jgi:hypothetical protein
MNPYDQGYAQPQPPKTEPASTAGTTGRLRETALRGAADLARGASYLAAQGARAITYPLGVSPTANHLLAGLTDFPPEDFRGVRTSHIFRAMASIYKHRLVDPTPLCRDIDDLLSRREWFTAVDAPPMEEPPIFVVDDFYDDPHAVRKLALGATYHHFRPCWYCTSKLDAGPDNFLHNGPEIRARLERIGGFPIEGADTLWTDRPWNGAFHYKTEEVSNRASAIHTHQTTDVRYGYNGIVYLNPPGTYPDKTGVSIWRDRRTGRCVASTKSFEIGFHNFEMALRVENKFNRLVLLRSDVWHLGEAGFGSSVRNGRLFQTFFFDLRGKYEQVVPQRETPVRL